MEGKQQIWHEQEKNKILSLSWNDLCDFFFPYFCFDVSAYEINAFQFELEWILWKFKVCVLSWHLYKFDFISHDGYSCKKYNVKSFLKTCFNSRKSRSIYNTLNSQLLDFHFKFASLFLQFWIKNENFIVGWITSLVTHAIMYPISQFNAK